jgi:hypothetical protein
LFLDSSFHDVDAKLTDMQIFSGKDLPFSVDVGAPKPIANAWQIDSTTADNNGVFTLGDEIKLTLSIDEAVTLAKVGRNKIVIAGKEFLLTGTNGTLTNTLVFAYTVKINDTIDGKYFNINNRRSIFLSDIVDTDGNSIDFSGINSPVRLSNTSLDTHLSVTNTCFTYPHTTFIDNKFITYT